MSTLFSIVLSLLGIFMILLVLVQRGRGGGLAGALGGMGGSSAFGAKAGDLFTRITIVTAAIWIVICLIAVLWAKHRGDVLGTNAASPAAEAFDMMPQKPTAEQGKAPGVDAAAPAATQSPPSTTEAPPATSPSNTSAPATPTDSAPSPPASSAPASTEKGPG